MNKISEIDKNFKIESKLQESDIQFHDIKDGGFSIYGVHYEDGKYVRMPQQIADTVSEGVAYLNQNTAGGRVCFRTDSPYVAIHTRMYNIGKMPHFTLAGSAGFDLYLPNEDRKYISTFMPPVEITDGYESIIHLGDRKMREILINFPLYSGVNELYIGLKEGSVHEEWNCYRDVEPVVFYGSSITQGGCASRPGNSYQAVVSRRLAIDFINLGFSGNCKAEPQMAEYISQLPMSAFVYDYDHNAPTAEFLESTHKPFFDILRKARPDLPIIFVTAPTDCFGDCQRRIDIIYSTYKSALDSGDRNVYFIDGVNDIFKLHDKEMMSVDACHPNDFGFFCMAEAFEKILKNII